MKQFPNLSFGGSGIGQISPRQQGIQSTPNAEVDSLYGSSFGTNP